jgi:hypothetical protein
VKPELLANLASCLIDEQAWHEKWANRQILPLSHPELLRFQEIHAPKSRANDHGHAFGIQGRALQSGVGPSLERRRHAEREETG